MITIGLTGGIGSGKSTVAQMLVDRGAAFVNADLVGHRSYLKGTATYEQLVAEFGREIVGAGGEVDRQRLGRRVFGDPQARERLNDIVWPAMAELMAQRSGGGARPGRASGRAGSGGAAGSRLDVARR